MSETNDQPAAGLWGATKETAWEFIDDDAMSHAASLAYYTGLSMGPLMALLAWATQFLSDEARGQIVQTMSETVGPAAAQPLTELFEQAQQPGMDIAGWISLGILVFSVTGTFAQLQYALNTMWDVQARPGEGLWGWVRKRVLSVGMLLTLGFLLVVSMVISAALAAVMGERGEAMPGVGDWVWMVVNNVASLLVLTGLFALMFQYLPDARVAWRDVWVGAALTAVLFTIGKYVLGLYVGMSDYASSYGAAVASFIALLIWVYYSAVIVFLGAEATQVYARRMGHPVEPDEHAVRIERRQEVAAA